MLTSSRELKDGPRSVRRFDADPERGFARLMRQPGPREDLAAADLRALSLAADMLLANLPAEGAGNVTVHQGAVGSCAGSREEALFRIRDAGRERMVWPFRPAGRFVQEQGLTRVLTAGAEGTGAGGEHDAAVAGGSPGDPAPRTIEPAPEPSARVQHPGARPGGKNVIAYSLYGSQLTYLVGAIKNAQIAQRVYPEFTCRFYYGASVPRWVLEILGGFGNVELVDMTGEPENHTSSMWRFLAAGDPEVDVYLCRDADSRPGARERAAVDEWLASGKLFHIMREHSPGHGIPISAGCWGCRGGALSDINDLIQVHGPHENGFGVDQRFLCGAVYPRALESMLVHDEHHTIEPWEFPNRRRFSVPGDDRVLYVGQARDENERDRYPDDAPGR